MPKEKDFKALKDSYKDSKLKDIIDKYKKIDDWIKQQKSEIKKEEERKMEA